MNKRSACFFGLIMVILLSIIVGKGNSRLSPDQHGQLSPDQIKNEIINLDLQLIEAKRKLFNTTEIGKKDDLEFRILTMEADKEKLKLYLLDIECRTILKQNHSAAVEKCNNAIKKIESLIPPLEIMLRNAENAMRGGRVPLLYQRRYNLLANRVQFLKAEKDNLEKMLLGDSPQTKPVQPPPPQTPPNPPHPGTWDTTIIVAIIGGVATVVAAIIGIFKKK